MNIRWFHVVTVAACISAFAAPGCQPTMPLVDKDEETNSQPGKLEISIDSGNGVDVDVDGKRGGQVDVEVDGRGVDVGVHDADQRPNK